MKTRIYLFTGFLDSGKTSFINDTITTTDFCEGEKSLLIVSEQGAKSVLNSKSTHPNHSIVVQKLKHDSLLITVMTNIQKLV